jgi:hypothetical protein
MRDLVTVRAEWDAAQAEYAARVGTVPEPEWRKLSDRVKALTAELSAVMTAGAVACSRCGKPPHGLRHVRGVVGRQVTFRHVYEIGCLACTDTAADDRRGFGETPARGSGPELDQYAEPARAEAVAAWNEKNAPGDR